MRKRTYYIVDYEHSVGYLKYVDHLKDFLSLYKVSRHENVNFTKGISQRVVDYLYESKDHVFFSKNSILCYSYSFNNAFSWWA